VIVSRSVGGAVERNQLRRRYRALGRSLVDDGAIGSDLVVRALPGSAQQTWAALAEDFRGVVASRILAAPEVTS
jgi:ribonuclease P protein component